jgi:hypothetical protein
MNEYGEYTCYSLTCNWSGAFDELLFEDGEACCPECGDEVFENCPFCGDEFDTDSRMCASCREQI